MQYFSYKYCKCSLSIIGYWTGNGRAFDHSSVRANIKRVQGLIDLRLKQKYVYQDVRDKIGELMVLFNAEFNIDEVGEDMESFARHNGDFLN